MIPSVVGHTLRDLEDDGQRHLGMRKWELFLVSRDKGLFRSPNAPLKFLPRRVGWLQKISRGGTVTVNLIYLQLAF